MRLNLKVISFLSLILLFLLIHGSSFAQGDWVGDGVPLSGLYPSDIMPGAMVADGSSGAIVVYIANHGCRPAIYAQHVDSLGNTLWSDPTMICSTNNRASGLQVISDGAGGAIFAWHNQRSGDITSEYDAFIQRIDSSGNGLWAENGVPLSEAAGETSGPHLIPDGAGGAIVVWGDKRNGDNDLYIQWIDSSGNAQWAANGIALCTAAGDQWSSRIMSDGAGGAFIVWIDQRSGNKDIYAQRINGSGTAQWAADGISLCSVSGDQWYPELIADGSGGAIVTWDDIRSGSEDIYAQRVDDSGAVLWSPHGIPICTAPQKQWHVQLTSDGEGGAIISWFDQRDGESDIYSQRVDGDGTAQWPVNGVAICTAADYQSNPQIVSDGAGGAVVAWLDARTDGGGVYAQRVDGSGAVLWVVDGIPICSVGGSFQSIMIDDTGGVIVSWRDIRKEGFVNVWELYAQRMTFSGTMNWTIDGVPLTHAMGDQTDSEAISDGSDGAIVVWADVREGGLKVYTQRVNANGTMQWTAGGVQVCNTEGSQSYPKVTSDGAGGAVITWSDNRNGNIDIYTQRLNYNGALQWAAGGIVLCADTMYQNVSAITSDGAGGGIVAWNDYRAGNYDIYARRVDGTGTVQWAADGVPICTESAPQTQSYIISDGAGGAILCWADQRNGDRDIYAQRVDDSGIVQWTIDGIPLCAVTGDQNPFGLFSDGAGGAIVIWEDQRNGNRDIYAQRFNGSGMALWTADGLALCTSAGDQSDPQAMSDGAGGAIVTWADRRSGNGNIYAQRVNASGLVQWAANGIAVCTAVEDQLTPSITAFGGSGCVITWADKRDQIYGGFPSTQDIYGQYLDINGIGQWTANGVVICDAFFMQKSPRLVSGGTWDAIVIWQDQACGYFDIVYAQRLSFSGVIVSTLLQNYSVVPKVNGIALDWTVSEMDRDVSFSVSRATAPRWIFEKIDDAEIERNGLSFSFTDAGCTPGGTYRYLVEYSAGDGNPKTLFETDRIAIPASEVTLYASYPNPFNPTATITFSLPRKMHAKLTVLNVEGKPVKTLIDGVLDGGHKTTIWDGTNEHGDPVSSGVYFYRLKAGKQALTRKMVLLK